MSSYDEKELARIGMRCYLTVMIILGIIWMVIGAFIYDESSIAVLLVLALIFSVMIFLAAIPYIGFIVQIISMIVVFVLISAVTGLAFTGLILAMFIVYGIFGFMMTIGGTKMLLNK